jgi:phosphatidyl-myo-inositol dimannoside synthase
VENSHHFLTGGKSWPVQIVSREGFGSIGCLPRLGDRHLSDSDLTTDIGMKILMLTDSFLPHAGGSREYYYNLYSRLAEFEDTRVTIATKKVPGWEEFDRRTSSDSFRVVRWLKPLSTWRLRELPKGLGPFLHAAWHVHKEKPTILHAGDLYPQAVSALILKRMTGLPYVAYCHGEDIALTDRYKYQPRVRDKIYLGADAVVANAEFARTGLLRLGVPEARIVKINPGVDFDRFSPRPVRQELIDRWNLRGRKVVLTVARLVSRKGHDLVLRALARLRRELPDAVYLIVGRGPEQQRLQNLAVELEMMESVRFAGHVPEELLPDCYNLCDVFAMLNREEANGDLEGFGMVFLEASAMGKPVIGGRSGGTADAIVEGKTGFRVDAGQLDELTGTLRTLLADTNLRRRLGDAGRDRVRRDFQWQDRARKLHDVSTEICKARSGEKRTAVLANSE